MFNQVIKCVSVYILGIRGSCCERLVKMHDSVKYIMLVMCKEVDIEADACVHNCDTIRLNVISLTSA